MLFDKREGRARAKWKLIGFGGKMLIDLIFAGSRIKIIGRRPIEELLESRQFIMTFWHSRILLVSYMHKGWNAAIMVSNSADGEIMAQVIQFQGHTAVRGSTRKGGKRALLRIAKEITAQQRPACVVPDGPQGPRHKVQSGVIILARQTGFPIIPVTYSARYRKQFASWDRFILPYPFSPGLLIYGSPITVPPDADMRTVLDRQQNLEKELNRITAAADDYFGHHFVP